MRELKFRAYYHWEKTMLCWQSLLEDHQDLAYAFTGNLAQVSPLMQYTGLKDKNGKDIYEGDIVRHGQDAPRVVTYHGATFVCTNPKFTNEWGTALWDYVLDGIEVIGNIYENPEML